MRVSRISPFIRTECGPPRTCLFCACLPLRSRSASGNSLLVLQLWQTMLAPYRACLWMAGYLQKRRAAAIGGVFLAFILYVSPPSAPRPPSTKLFTLLYTINSPLLRIDYSAISFSLTVKDGAFYIPFKQTDSAIQWTSDIYPSFQL